ncbi:uncharacterized protein LOC123920523 isoform X2 [Trifolium pratense]|nr:uncharacterized protein LOC123920523 isoform X2 [Trifolium pratense]
MANRRERDLIHRDGVDPLDGEDFNFDDSSSVESYAGSGSGGGSVASSSSPGDDDGGGLRSEVGLTERLTDIIVDESDGDLLIQQTNCEERLLQWLQALDMQVIGACRADERLKPLLKMNTVSGVSEDPLLTQLIQHFEPSEVGMLARCFCLPLVTIRVGKISKEGTRLCPTANRGNLTLVLLPSSDLRLSFIGDDGKTERLFTLSSTFQCSSVVVQGIPTDSSGRSFHVTTPDDRTFFFWCSEKSKLLGVELLAKMEDLLKRKPSIAELSGISKSRLDCFATQLRAFLVGSTGGGSHDSSACASMSANSTAFGDVPIENSHSSSSKFPRSRHIVQTTKGDSMLYQSILSPRSSSFKEVPPRNLSSHRIAAREKIKRRGDNQQQAADNLDLSSTSDHGKASDVTKTLPFSPNFMGSAGMFNVPSSLGPGGEVTPVVSPLFSPYYCWCPPGISSTFPSIAALPQSPVSFAGSQPLASGASLLPNTLAASLFQPIQPLNLGSSMDFPPFFPEPLVRMSLPTSQQIPTFTPLMCDPIVHVPIIDVCSSGQGYLVSAGPAMSTSIPPLHPNLVNPLISESDAVVKGARETLRLLIGGSSQGNQQVMIDPFPAILTNLNENQNNVLVAGSRGLYTGTRDINVIANSIAAMGLVSLSGASNGDNESDSEVCGGNYGILEAIKKSNDAGGAFSDEGGPFSK